MWVRFDVGVGKVEETEEQVRERALAWDRARGRLNEVNENLRVKVEENCYVCNNALTHEQRGEHETTV